jgi:DNA polymerase-3 subunit gamma/tau
MSLYHKYRPGNFSEIMGNEEIVTTLKADLAKEQCPHVFLFHGPTGCGKTTLGRIVVKELGCSNEDFTELDIADFRGIDTVREIRRQVAYKPLNGKCRIWLLDEVHKLTTDAQNALLKVLEDTPQHVYFILATTDPQKLLPTVRGRCSSYAVSQLNDTQMLGLLRKVARAEGCRLTKEVYDQIIQDSQGHPRNALQILDQVISAPEETRLEIAKRTAEIQSDAIELCRALVQKAPWKKVAGILSKLKEQEPESIRRLVLGYCNSILLKGENMQAGLIMENFIEPFYNTGFPGLTFACFSVVCGNN